MMEEVRLRYCSRETEHTQLSQENPEEKKPYCYNHDPGADGAGGRAAARGRPGVGRAKSAMAEAPAHTTDRIADRMTDSSSNSVYTPGLPAFASLAAAPPTPAPTAGSPRPRLWPRRRCLPVPPTTASTTVGGWANRNDRALRLYRHSRSGAGAAEAHLLGEPIHGPIPIPPRKPRLTVAHVASCWSLPRPRPAETTVKPDSDAQYFERHTVQDPRRSGPAAPKRA